MAAIAPSRISITNLLVATLVALTTFVLCYAQALLPVEYLVYDRLLRLQPESTSDQVVIVAMDEKSLQRFGSMPWPRDAHAQLINRLTQAGAKAIGYDVLFDKSGKSDQHLIQAVKRNDKLVFPVIIEALKQDGQLLELQPFPALNQVTKGLGLVHFDLSQDNIARGVHLRAGLGEPFWRAFAAEVLEIANGDPDYQLPLEPKNPQTPSYDLKKIERQQFVLLPFKQNPNYFPRISFVDLLDQDQLLPLVKDKVVFVGVTATAVRNADFLPVPVDREGQIMPGVEINATLFDSLLNNNYIQPATKLMVATVAALMVFAFFMMLPISFPRHNFYYFIGFVLIIIFAMWFLLHHARQWWPLTTPLIIMAVSYLLWSWRKVVANMVFFNHTINRLQLESAIALEFDKTQSTSDKLQFWQHLGLIKSWREQPINDQQNGELKSSHQHWLTIDQKQWLVEPESLSKKDQRLLNKLIAQQTSNPIKGKVKTSGVIENRVLQVENAITKMNFLRRFVEQSIDKLADGVILSDNLGQVFYTNIEAKNIFPQLRNGQSVQLFDLLHQLKIPPANNWKTIVKQVLQEGIGREVQALSHHQRDLKIGLSLLNNIAGKDFIIINLSDITSIKREQRRQLEMIDFISHDLRSPMTSILALLGRYKSHPEEFADGALSNEIERLTRSSLSLAEHFLMLSRAESHVEIAIYPVELLNTIDNALAIVMPLAKQKNILIDFDFLAHEDIWLKANEDLLGRVIVNLLTNAVKYSPKNSAVKINIENTESALQVKFLDQGEGIDKQQMASIFKPFTRMQRHEMAKVKGIGLGLRFVRAAMLRFGGSVSVESELGQGSCFTLNFPNAMIVEDSDE